MKKFLEYLPQSLFLLLAILTPIQLGKHFWPNFAQVLGIRIDFLSPTVFLTDLVIFGFVISSVLKLFLQRTLPQKEFLATLFLFLLTLGIATVFAKNNLLSFWFFLKFFEFSSLAYLISVLDFSKIYYQFGKFLSFAGLFSVVLALFQFWQQESLGLWLLGERNFNLTTPQIAKVELGGAQMLRPYATFPHPNVLAGFLAFIILFLVTFNLPKVFKFATWGVLVFGLVLTFSRSAWIGLLTALGVFSFLKIGAKKTVGVFLLLFILFLITILLYPENPVILRFWQLTGTDSHSLTLRTKLAKAALAIFLENPLTGVGLGNFLKSLPAFWEYAEDVRFLQPVHNIFLLILAETGILGILGFSYLLFKTAIKLFKNNKQLKFFLPIWVLILVISAFDHYFWTLQQGQILFWLILGLSWAHLPVSNMLGRSLRH